MSEAELLKTMGETKKEMQSSLAALMKLHGAQKVMFAMSLVSAPKFISIAKEGGMPDEFSYMLSQQLQMMLTQWGLAAKFDDEEMFKLAKGIQSQMALVEYDLLEAASSGNNPKEK